MPLRERTAIGLRNALRDWPIETVREAVHEALGERDGARLVAHWLVEEEAEDYCPPLSPEEVETIWDAARKRQQ